MSSVHHVHPRFLCRLAVTDRCAGAPAPSAVSRGLPGGTSPHAVLRGVVLGRGAVALFALATLASAGCGGIETAEASMDRSLRFEGSAPTLEVLGERVVEAFTRGDTVALSGFRLTEREHNEVVWPELPASAPEVNFPVDFAWQNIETRNRSALLRTMPIYADRQIEVRRVECRGETQRFDTFDVLTDCWVVFDWNGERWEDQLFKDVLIRGGGVKLFRYYDEAPQRYRGGSAR